MNGGWAVRSMYGVEELVGMYRALKPKRVFAVGLMAMGLVLAPGFSMGASAAEGLDTAVATGNGGGFSNVNINAQGDPTGLNANGTASVTFGASFLLSGPVTCLSVTGPDLGGGTLGSPTTAVLNFQDQREGIVTVQLVDNGGNGADILTAIISQRVPTDCSPLVIGFSDALVNGRATVFDAPLLPKSKDQCEHGGWQQFGSKNQGQCIKSVNH